MSQHDYNIANQTFPATRTDLNNALGAIATNNAGNSAPATTYSTQWFFDNDDNKLYLRNKDNDNWVEILTIGATSDAVESIGATGRFNIASTETVFNESSADIDFRVESNGNANMLFVNGGDDAVGIGTNVTNSRRLVIGTGGAKTATSTHYVMNIGQTTEASSHAGLGVYFVGGASAAVRKWQFQPVENGVANDGIIEFCPNGGKTAFIGNVGIGTSSPNQELTVVKAQNSDTAIRIANGTGGTAARSSIFLDVDSGGAQLMAIDDGFSTSGAYIADGVTFVSDTAMANGMTIGTRADNNNAHLRFYTKDVEVARFRGEHGRFISYANAPSDIGFQLFNTSTSAPNGGMIYFNNVGASGADNNTQYFLACGDTTAFRAYIYSDGDLQNHDNSYGAISDERIKDNITDANSQWDDIKNIRVRNFQKKDDIRDYGVDEAKVQLGVIAQELEEVSPKLVKEYNPSHNDIMSDSSFGTLWTADDPETQDAVEEVLYTADDPETQDILYTADDVETQDVLYTEDDELPEGIEVGDVKELAKKSVGDVKEPASASVGDVKIQAEESTKKIGEVKEIKEQVKGVNYSILYMKAIKALQEAMDRIETLESKVATLEG